MFMPPRCAYLRYRRKGVSCQYPHISNARTARAAYALQNIITTEKTYAYTLRYLTP